ncbi:MAG: hypothetical protein WC521_00550 [Bdellovibrionales bacterium]
MNALYLLGAKDPEMDRLDEVLESRGQSFDYATKNGRRVSPANAYAADPVPVDDYDMIIYIECRTIPEPKGIDSKIIDHHREGDPGYNMGPKDYWEASSLGQLFKQLNIVPTRRDLVVAAMDHCFSAALRGECPDHTTKGSYITKEEVLDLKVAEIAEGSNTDKAYVRQRVRHFGELLSFAPSVIIGSEIIKDLRHKYLGEGYSLDLLSAQIAVALSGKAALLCNSDPNGKSKKITIYGNIRPETITAFIERWAPSQGLTDIYGVPHRGYAGAFERLKMASGK